MSYHECKYCLQKFARESNYNKHQCEQMVKAKIMRMPVGVSAYEYYCLWFKQKGYRIRNKEEFMDSRSFKSFINFSKFARKMAIPAIEKYIELMVELDIHPKDWSNRAVYDHYINNLDLNLTADEQFDISMATIYELARIYDCETSEVFLFMEPADIIKIVQAKKLSPWFLLNSVQFLNFISRQLTREQRILLDKYINSPKWEKEFKKYPKRVSKFRGKVKKAGL